MNQRLGILGGTFNPIHLGHLAAAEEVRDRLKLEKVLFIPSFIPPHKNDEVMPSAVQRQEMVRLAVKGNAHFSVSDIEIKRGGRSYTIDTIEALRQAHPGAELHFITGLDSFLEIGTWKEWERLLTLCSFVVLSREGHRFQDIAGLGFLDVPQQELMKLDAGEKNELVVTSGAMRVSLEMIPFLDISSTDIRQRIRSGRSIKYHLPEAVEHYIIENKLYA
ncbi:MAG: nicotinate-nucleotide adenylyltransferase [Nitrospirota bacterium]